jgi:hypothetical protein
MTFDQTLFQLRTVGVEASLRKRAGGGFEACASVRGDIDQLGMNRSEFWHHEPVKARTTRDAEKRALVAIAKLITNSAARIEAKAAELLERSKVLRAEAERLVQT